MNDIPIEFWGVVIVALFSIFGDILVWFLNYRSAQIKFETEARAGYIQEILRDHYRLFNFIRQLRITPLKTTALKTTEEINKMMNARPFNFKVSIIEEWRNLYDVITLTEGRPSEEQISTFEEELWESLHYFDKEYKQILGIKRDRAIYGKKHTVRAMQQNDEANLRALYSHISRMFNSSINALTAVIFGWLAIFGLSMNPSIRNVLSKEINLLVFSPNLLQTITLVAATIFGLMALYFFYFRILQFARWIYKIENDLRLRGYYDTLPLSRGIRKVSIRKNLEKWTNGEIISAILLASYFLGTTIILLVTI